MKNAKDELLMATSSLKIIAVDINYLGNNYILYKNYDTEQFNSFIESLNFEYDSGYGSQVLHGVIWCTDGTWLHRGEYDGSEWWEVNKYPSGMPINIANDREIILKDILE